MYRTPHLRIDKHPFFNFIWTSEHLPRWTIFWVIKQISIHWNKKIQVRQCIFCDHNEIELKIHNRKLSENFSNVWKQSSTLLNMPWVKEDLKKVIRKDFEVNENKNTRYQDLWDAVKAVHWGKFTGLLWKKN